MAKAILDFKEMEEKWKKFWEKEKIYKFNSTSKKSYSIDTPPPTVSGKMHLGHAFSYSQQDFIARFRRMFEGNVFYPFGTDDNGLPTERLIEKLKKVKSKEMSRAEFIKLCLKTLKEVTPNFIQDWKDLGMSCDFNLKYSTIDNNSRKISQKSFIELYKKGEIYEKKFPTLWCPECQTSIAQAELEDKEKETTLNYIKAKLEDGSFLIYATTRPELHPGCIGISLNEKGDYVKIKRDNGEEWIISQEAVKKMEDEFPMKIFKKFKGKELVGKKVEILFAEQPVFVSHDISAKTEYGTGIVYYCSYGGLDCIQWLSRHPKAKAIQVMDESGTYTKGPAKGMKSDKAREKILELLGKEKYLIKKEKMNHAVNVHDRCGTDIEFVGTEQWFIKLLDKKDNLIQQGKEVKWYPEFMYKRYENWVKGLEWDWSISRDRHFGIPIPVWKCKECNEIILPSEKELPVDPLQTKKKCPKCGKEAIPEKKVLDTWATSSLTPQIASSLINNKIKIPFSLRPNAHDIIRTWAFYTIVKSYLHEEKIPWKDIVISGVVSLGGEKMSKSKGNVIAPQDVLDEYGADALRFWAAGSKLGSDLDYQEKDLITGKKFITKLLNASKFVFMNLENYNKKKPKELEPLDELFLERLNSLIQKSTSSFEKYEYSKARSNVEEFFWNDFCNNYLEIVKKRVYQGEGNKKLSAQYTLYKSLLTILKLIAPIMPFITEEIYQNHFKKTEKDESIHISKWPKIERTSKITNDFNFFCDLLAKVRQEKTNTQKPMNAECIITLDAKDFTKIKTILNDFENVTNSKEIKQGKFKVEFL
jgi:valyl-tRNA synthetase